MSPKKFFIPAIAFAAFVAASAGCAVKKSESSVPLPEVNVYKDPNCGCCSAWADHLRANGFKVKVIETRNMSEVKSRLGVPSGMTSCHTAKVGDYVIEGHVPASSIQRLLREKPAVSGLAVPGMPVGSPGMEQGDKHDSYDVITFSEKGEPAVYERF